MSARSRTRRAARILPLLLTALLLTGCLEQITTTRIPAGAARNFLYYLANDEQADANAYWAPDYAPADAQDQVQRAATTLRGYILTETKADSETQSDGSVIVTLSGQAVPKPATPGPVASPDPLATPTPLLRARMIERGPGWRVTEFTLLCCATP